MPTSAPPEIFKAYDIRGLYGEEIDGDVAEGIGRAFARVLGKLAGKPPSELRVGLGRDMRLTAPELAARYRDGLMAEGAHVLDAGMVGTEMLYYLVGSRDCDVVVDDPNVSRRHAEVRPSGGSWTVHDLGSTNGIKVNGRRVDGPQSLRAGDTIQLGTASLTFELE